METLREKRKKEGGFTLIELLIVIAIIAILAAIALPQFNKYRKNAEKAAVESAVRNCITEIESKFAENPGYTVTGNECDYIATQDPSIASVTISGGSTNYTVTAEGKTFGVECVGGSGQSVNCTIP